MINQFYIKNEKTISIIKPLGYNESIYNIDVHFLPKLNNFKGSIIECINENCKICKIYNWLIENNLYTEIRNFMKYNNSHLNIGKNKLFILPIYSLFKNKWYFNYFKLFESQFIDFYNFLEKNDIFDIGDPMSNKTINIIKNNNNYEFNLTNIEFIINPIDLKKDYESFKKLLSNIETIGIITDLNDINLNVERFIIQLKHLIKNKRN